MKESLIKFLERSQNNTAKGTKSTGLYVVEMPTGSGKTYQSMDFVRDYLEGKLDKFHLSHIFYLTPLRKNIKSAYKELEDKFDTTAGKELLRNNSLIIPANSESVIDALSDDSSKISESNITRLRTFAPLFNHVQSMNKADSSLQQDFRELIQNKYEPDYRKELSNYLRRIFGGKYDEKLKIVQDQYPWLLKAYPAILSKKRKVILLSVSKFYAGNDPIIESTYSFLDNSITNDSVILIDESDAAKSYLLKQQIENCVDYKLDLLTLVNRLYHSTNKDEVPSALFHQIKDEDTDEKKTTKCAYDKLCGVCKETYEDHNLAYQFKLDADADSQKFFLFHDYTTTTIYGNDQSEKLNIFIKYDSDRKLNVISLKEEEKSDNFNYLVRSLQGAVNYFIGFSTVAAWNYMEYVNSKDRKKEPLQFPDAVSSVLNDFHLENKTVTNLQRIVLNNRKLAILKNQKNPLNYDFYSEGFEYYSFSNDDSHDMNTFLSMTLLDDTPEKFILAAANKCRVVLFSATAEADTIIGNFNLRYLKDKLGGRYYLPDDEDRKRIKENYEKRLKKNQINPEAIGIFDEKAPAESLNLSDPAKEKLEELIYPYSEKENKDTGGMFHVDRFIRDLIAIRKFLECPSSRVLLMMTNSLLKKSGELFSSDNLLKGIKIVCKDLTIKEPVLIALSSSEYNAKIKLFQKEVKENKVILVTTYRTAGTGQNINYSDELDNEEYDIDSIYLEKPTYIISKIESRSDETDIVNFIYQVLSLREAGELTTNESRLLIQTAFQNYQKLKVESNQIMANIYGSDDVNNCAVSVFKQAVGRISRSKKKREITNVFIDDGIVNKLDFATERNHLETPEFRELINYCEGKVNNHKSQDVKQCHVILNRIGITTERYHQLMKRNERNEWSEDNIRVWQELREFVLKHPTISEKELSSEENESMRNLYLPKSVNSNGIDEYFYAFSSSGNGGEKKITDFSYFKNRNCNRRISSSALYLDDMINCEKEYVLNYFLMKGYAISFEKSDYILLPNIFHDIYLGALGEEIGRCILEFVVGKKIVPIEDPKDFEKFDFQLAEDKDIYFDFKYWISYRPLEKEQVNKFAKKLAEVHGKAAFIINIFVDSDCKYKAYPAEDAELYMIPDLFTIQNGKAVLDVTKLDYLKENIKKELQRHDFKNKDK